jgi:predicted transcriptional regulator
MGFFTNTSKLEKLEARFTKIEKENEELRLAMTEISKNLVAVDGMIKIMMTAQQQLAMDMNTIYDALNQVISTSRRGVVDPLEEYLVKMNPFGSDDDDGGLPN